MDGNAGAQPLDRSQRPAIVTNRADRRRSLDALHEVESRAGNASPGREDDWVSQVRAALRALDEALGEQSQNSVMSDSPLSDIEQEHPRLRNRVLQLRERSESLRARVGALESELHSRAPEHIDAADIRRMLEGLAAELRYLQAREADLVYEAYTVDLGAGD